MKDKKYPKGKWKKTLKKFRFPFNVFALTKKTREQYRPVYMRSFYMVFVDKIVDYLKDGH